MKKKVRFVSLMQDIVFKTMWQKDDLLIQDYFRNLLKYITKIDISNYNFNMNDIPINNDSDIQSKADILLESQDKQIKINLELNPVNKRTTQNKNNSYVYKIASGMYNRNCRNKYEGKIRVIQINFNGFYFKKKRNCPITRYKLYDRKINDTINDIEIINIFLPVFRKLCYNNGTEIYKDFAMFDVKNYDEMAELAKNDERRLKIMEAMKEMSEDETVPTYNYTIYKKNLEDEIKEEILQNRYKKGKRVGRQEGRQEGENNIINKLLSSGMSKKELSKRLGMPIL